MLEVIALFILSAAWLGVGYHLGNRDVDLDIKEEQKTINMYYEYCMQLASERLEADRTINDLMNENKEYRRVIERYEPVYDAWEQKNAD